MKAPPTARQLHPTDDALVLASVGSPAERELLNDWLEAAAPRHPEAQHRGAATAQRRRSAAGAARAAGRISWTPTRTAPSCRSACSGCPAGCPPGRRWRAAGRPRHRTGPPNVAAAQDPAQGPVAGPGGRRRTGEGVRAASAVAATPPSPRSPLDFARFVIRRASAGHRTRRIAVARAGVQVAAAGQARDVGVGALPRGAREDPRRHASRRPARCSTNSPPGGAGSPST